MNKIKSFFKYLAGSDVLENRKGYYQNIEERSLGIKMLDVADDIIAFGRRYVPTVMEIDGVRRLINGQYIGGTIELLTSEYIRISEYFDNKRERTLMDFAKGLKQLGEEANQKLGKSVQELEAVVKKLEVNSQ